SRRRARVLRARQRRGVRHGERRPPLHALPAPARQGDVRGDRDRARDRQADRAAPRRPRLGERRAGQGRDLLLHARAPPGGRVKEPLRLLLAEDSEDDAILVALALEQHGFELAARRVADAGGLRAALASEAWDVVVSDYSMPGFGGLQALALVREMRPDLPFVLVSAAIGEDTAVDAMKAGAADYVMKGNLARLGPAVERELREAATRREKRAAE